MAINVLSPKVFNRIAAGEVVERPASIVKELVENSLDAGATEISVEIEGGGISRICVSDNGCGIEKEDLPLAFLPHATSKIKELDDLDSIATMGFRGEALASIASVCMVTLSTKTKNALAGFKIEANGGEISRVVEVARVEGTTVCACNLFYNTPVRAKFLKKPKTEEGEITHLMEKFMLSHPEIAFTYVVDGKQIYMSGNGTLDEVIYLIYGREVYNNLLKLDHQEDGVHVSGFVASPKLTRPNRTYQSLFVNGRFVENYMISSCVQGAFEPLLMKGRFPIYVIKLSIPYDRVDVNVHPNKREVKFDNSSLVFGIVRRAVEKALLGTDLISEFEFKFKTEEACEKFDIAAELHPGQTSFNSHPKTNFDKLSDTEGSSFLVKVDSDEALRDIASPNQLKKQGVNIINVPDFANVKMNSKKNKNKSGGNIFFDHSGDSLLREVEISVQNDSQLKLAQTLQKLEESQCQKENSVVEEKFLKVDSSQIKVLGVAFLTYVVVEFDNALYVIDQHAMHERQNYDRLKAEIEKNNVAKQELLVPYEIKLLAKDSQILQSRLADLEKIGFEVVQKDNNFVVKAVPFVLLGINIQKFVQEILQEENKGSLSASGLINEKLCQTACKHSIRAGDSISKEEILFLIERIKDGVPLCPHGRPIVVKISRKELEKMFGRVQ